MLRQCGCANARRTPPGRHLPTLGPGSEANGWSVSRQASDGLLVAGCVDKEVAHRCPRAPHGQHTRKTIREELSDNLLSPRGGASSCEYTSARIRCQLCPPGGYRCLYSLSYRELRSSRTFTNPQGHKKRAGGI